MCSCMIIFLDILLLVCCNFFLPAEYEEAGQLCKDYSNTKGPGTQAKPEKHQFFRRLAPIVTRTLEKCERENGMM